MNITTIVVGAYQVNCYIIRQDKHVLIIDPGSNFDKISESILDDEIVDGIILTHGHFDHIGAADKLSRLYKTKIYINDLDKKLASDPLADRHGFSGIVKEPMYSLHEPSMKIGVFDFEVIFTPGHTIGSSCLKFNEHLFSGDFLFKNSIGRCDLATGNESEMRRSLRIVYDLDPKTIVYPGHGDFTNVDDELNFNPYLR